MLSRSSLFLFAVLLCNTAAYAQQLNPLTGGYDPIPPDAAGLPSALSPAARGGQAGLECDSTVFYTVTSNEIRAFTLVNDVISGPTVVLSGLNGAYMNLAVCNNLNGGSYTPTFYGEYSVGAYGPAYYDGTGFVMAPGTHVNRLYNPGGNGDFLYYQGYLNGQLREIVRYDGNTLNVIYTTPPGITIGLADLAVDDNGNVYLITSPGGSVADYIVVLSPTGQVVQQYPFTHSVLHAYGCFLLDGVLYLGLGESNPTSPNTLLPVTFSGGVATAGTPIPFPNATYLDMANCGQARQGCPELTFNLTVSVTKTGLSTGAVRAVVSGGAEPYQYSLDNSNFQSSNQFSNLGAGSYTLFVTDADGCSGQADFVIEEANCCGIR